MSWYNLAKTVPLSGSPLFNYSVFRDRICFEVVFECFVSKLAIFRFDAMSSSIERALKDLDLIP